jgi:plastocyanin
VRRGVVLILGLAALWPAAPASADSVAVSISGLAYSPQALQVHAGDTVTWTNNDRGVAHSVTADDGSFDSSPGLCGPGVMLGCRQPGQAFSHTFLATGTFDYHCRVHSFMQGRVTVTEVPVTTLATTTTLRTTSTVATTTSSGPTTSIGTTTTVAGGIGQDLPVSTAPGAAGVAQGTTQKHSSNAGTIAILAACILLAAGGIGAVIYRIRVDRAGSG